jgi:hypothetical protein
VHQTAKENYCNQAKIQSEQLALRLKIAEKCRYVGGYLSVAPVDVSVGWVGT